MREKEILRHLREANQEEPLLEKFTPDEIETIKGVVTKVGNLMNLRRPLEAEGFKVDFSLSPIPHMTVEKRRGSGKFVLLNKKYADKPDFVVGDIAGGMMD